MSEPSEPTSEWMTAHKGEYLRSEGYTWECDDDFCNCSQAIIVDIYRNKGITSGPPAVVRVGAWEGTFFTDGESGADAELAAERARLREADPQREATIAWQQGVDYAPWQKAGGRDV